VVKVSRYDRNDKVALLIRKYLNFSPFNIMKSPSANQIVNAPAWNWYEVAFFVELPRKVVGVSQ